MSQNHKETEPLANKDQENSTFQKSYVGKATLENWKEAKVALAKMKEKVALDKMKAESRKVANSNEKTSSE